MAVNREQVAGLVLLLIGFATLFLLRGPLYTFIVVVLNLIGIFVGILLIVIGVALIIGGRRTKRRAPWGWGSTALPIRLRDG